MLTIDVCLKEVCLLMKSYLQQVAGVESAKFGVFLIVKLEQSLEVIQIE